MVYKVDRLTRSLADFAKMVELFDAHGVSFVSVTQQFNTTTSMGRLTLNVLLSFAQFERELTGERIRDKIAASKQKGLWMGGVPPLGYQAKDRKLVVNDAEAGTVRRIFTRYLALGSVHRLRDALKSEGIVSRARVYRTGRQVGGKPLGRGALYRMLQNRIYLGEIVHKEKSYPGEHAAIIDESLWRSVQAQLDKNRVARAVGEQAQAPSLLAGRLFDTEGHRLTRSHAVKGGKRYRYYVSQALTVGRAADVTNARRIPAGELEELVMQRVQQFFTDRGAVLSALHGQVEAADALGALLERAAALSVSWPTLTPVDLRALVMSLVKRVSVQAKQVQIEIMPASLPTVLTQEPSEWAGTALGKDDDSARVIGLSVSATLKRAGLGTRLVVDGRGALNGRTTPDPTLMNLLVKAHDFHAHLVKSRSSSLREVARAAGVTPSYFTRLLRLAYLAPDITHAIVQGAQPPTLTARLLAKASRLPLDWGAQRRLLGFD